MGQFIKAAFRRLVRADPSDRWAAAFGRIAVYSFAVTVVTGVLLLPFFQPSMAPVVYHGSYRKLDGLTMSRAFASALHVSFDVRGGLLIRQVHHWSADLFVAAVCLRLIRVFFGGRFHRDPRANSSPLARRPAGRPGRAGGGPLQVPSRRSAGEPVW